MFLFSSPGSNRISACSLRFGVAFVQVVRITRQSQIAVLQQLSELEQGTPLGGFHTAAAHVDIDLLQLWTSSTPASLPTPSHTSFRNSDQYSNVLLQHLKSSKLLR